MSSAIALTLGAALAVAAAAPTAQPDSYGVWRNPKDSVHVEVKPCGKGACGVVVWANDKRHTKYCVSVTAGAAATVGMLSWIIFIAAGLGYQPGLTWIPWIVPMVLGTAASIAAAVYLGKTRTRQDTERLTTILKL